MNNIFHRYSPAKVISASFALLVSAGTVLLSLPVAARDGQLSFSEALFTSTSAACVTGLSLFDTYTRFSFFGQAVILLLIQTGGLGLVSFAAFYSIMAGRKLGFKALKTASDSAGENNIGHISLFLRTVFVTAFTCEFIGFVSLCFVFVPRLGLLNGLWTSLFTAVSAFCNAGFDLSGQFAPDSSLTVFADSLLLNLSLVFLITSGGLGFAVWQDIMAYKTEKKLHFHSKVVLCLTLFFTVAGAAGFLFTEYSAHFSADSLPLHSKILRCVFQSVTCRTAGFATTDQSQLTFAGKVLCCVLMFAGAAPGGTGGGIKITTVGVMVSCAACTLTGKNETVLFRHRISQYNVYKAFSISLAAIIGVFFVACVICISTPAATAADCIFEAFSAFSTAGLSCGITSAMGTAGRFAATAAMFCGRIGPVVLAMSIFPYKNDDGSIVYPDGRLIVG